MKYYLRVWEDARRRHLKICKKYDWRPEPGEIYGVSIEEYNRIRKERIKPKISTDFEGRYEIDGYVFNETFLTLEGKRIISEQDCK